MAVCYLDESWKSEVLELCFQAVLLRKSKEKESKVKHEKKIIKKTHQKIFEYEKSR